MKYAYYEFVTNEEEKRTRLQQIKEATKNDPAYYSSYLEVASKYDAPLKAIRALKSLKAAIRKGKIKTIVISSFENIYMEETHTLNLLLHFMNSGIQIAVGDPTNIQTEEDIYARYVDAQMECIMTVLSIPMITMEKCAIYLLGNTPFIRLIADCSDEDLARYKTRMLYVDAVEKYRETGFFFYRSDVKAWYAIHDYIANEMLKCYHLCNKIQFENILLENTGLFL